jgi:hypothetical protein
MAPIPVPKPPPHAYNPRRRPGTLLQNQIAHLEWATRPAAKRKPGKLRIKPAKTEAEAAARIAKLTQRLQRQQTAPTAKEPQTRKRKYAGRRRRRTAK